MFSMCSELTPRARIPDNRIPQLMQPCFQGAEEQLILMMMELMMVVVLPTIVMMMMMISSKEPRSTNWRSSRQLFRKVEMSRALVGSSLSF